MSRFDLYKVGSGKSYLLDLQSDLLDIQSTRMMAPVVPMNDVPQGVRGLHPHFDIDGDAFTMATHLMGAVPVAALKSPAMNLSEHADEITRALDILFQGY